MRLTAKAGVQDTSQCCNTPYGKVFQRPQRLHEGSRCSVIGRPTPSLVKRQHVSSSFLYSAKFLFIMAITESHNYIRAHIERRRWWRWPEIIIMTELQKHHPFRNDACTPHTTPNVIRISRRQHFYFANRVDFLIKQFRNLFGY